MLFGLWLFNMHGMLEPATLKFIDYNVAMTFILIIIIINVIRELIALTL